MADDAPLNLDRLAERCDIDVYEDQFDGFLGLCLRVGDRHGIALATGQIHARRRFTLAHELGHACMPGHSKAAVLQCLATDLSGADPDKMNHAGFIGDRLL
jgi:Zn-dependent peptidase ImmA (M78 family)